MAISRKLQYIELLREFVKNPPDSLPTELQATLNASIAAYSACTKAKRKRWRQLVRDDQASSLASLPISEAAKAKIAAGLNAEIDSDPDVN